MKGKADTSKTEKPLFVKYGLIRVTQLVEAKKAKLVVLARDVRRLLAVAIGYSISYCLQLRAVAPSRARLASVNSSTRRPPPYSSSPRSARR